MAKVFIGYDTYSIEGVNEKFIHFIFDMILAHTASSQNYEVGLIFSSDEHIKGLNDRYLNRSGSTNVLAFSNKEIKEGVKDFISAPENEDYLGDIYISYDSLMKEAHQLGIPLRERFAQLFVHGTLHLIGFDHKDLQDAKAMEGIEDKIVHSML